MLTRPRTIFILIIFFLGFSLSLQAEENLSQTYLNPDWIEKSVKSLGYSPRDYYSQIDSLIKYCRNNKNKNMQTVGSALDLSRHLLRKNRHHVRELLQARLVSFKNPALNKFQQLPVKPDYALTIQLRSEWPSFNQANGALVRTIQLNQDDFRILAISPDGKQLAYDDGDLVTIRNIYTGDFQYVSGRMRTNGTCEKIGTVYSLLFSQDGQQIIVGLGNGTIRVKNLSSKKPSWLVRVFKKDISTSQHVDRIALTPDGTQVMAARSNGSMNLIDISKGTEINVMDGTKEKYHNTQCLLFTPDGKHIISNCSSRLCVWNVLTARQHLKFKRDSQKRKRHTSDIQCVAITPDGKNIISGSTDNTVKVWDFQSGQLIRTIEGFSGDVNQIAVTSNGKQIITSSNAGIIKLWNLANGQLVWKAKGHHTRVLWIKLISDGKQLISADTKGFIKIWDIDKMKPELAQPKLHQHIDRLSISADGKTILSSSVLDGLNKWNRGVGKSLPMPKSKIVSRYQQHDIAFRYRHVWTPQKGKMFVLLTSDGKQYFSNSQSDIELRNVSTGEHLRLYEGHKGIVRAAVLTHDGKKMISGADDNKVIMWDVATGIIIKRFKHHVGPIQALLISPNGKQVLIASNKKIKIRDIASGQLKRVIRGHSEKITCLAITPDGKRVISGSLDSTVRVTDIKSGRTLRKFKKHTNTISGIAITTDGKWIISSSYDKTVNIWDVERKIFRSPTYQFSNAITALAFSKDNKTIVVSDDYAKVHKFTLMLPKVN